MKLSKNFNSEEFKCPCCGIENVSIELVYYLQKVRDKLGVPVEITSGCRCEKHNAKVGGVKNSDHITTNEKPCKAADIKVNGYSVEKLDIVIRECDYGDLRYTGKTTHGSANHISVLKKVK